MTSQHCVTGQQRVCDTSRDKGDVSQAGIHRAVLCERGGQDERANRKRSSMGISVFVVRTEKHKEVSGKVFSQPCLLLKDYFIHVNLKSQQKSNPQ